jgi:hypothetical protein
MKRLVPVRRRPKPGARGTRMSFTRGGHDSYDTLWGRRTGHAIFRPLLRPGSLCDTHVPQPLFLLSAPRGWRLPGSEGLAMRSYKGKPAAEGGSTAGQFRKCTYKYGFGKVALYDVVSLLEDRCLSEPVPLGVSPLQHQGAWSAPLNCHVLITPREMGDKMNLF